MEASGVIPAITSSMIATSGCCVVSRASEASLLGAPSTMKPSLSRTNCIVRTSPDHLVATIGLHDFIVVHTPDATLIARRDDENAIRELVEKLEDLGYERFL